MWILLLVVYLNYCCLQDKLRCRRIFNVPLHTLELTDVILANGGIAQVPLFVSDACQRILEQVHTEGLFRKAGSSKRQQEIKVCNFVVFLS